MRQKVSRDEEIQRVYGVSPEVWQLFRDLAPRYRDTPLWAYSSQKYAAKRRGIGWNLNLMDWWAIWIRSGKYLERGRGKDKYNMCRLFDDGPYEVGNVYISKNNQAHRKVFSYSPNDNLSTIPASVPEFRQVTDSYKPTKILEKMGY